MILKEKISHIQGKFPLLLHKKYRLCEVKILEYINFTNISSVKNVVDRKFKHRS